MHRQRYEDHLKEITRKRVIRNGVLPIVNGMQISMIIVDTTGEKWLPIMINMGIILIPISHMTVMMSPLSLSTELKEIIRAAGIIRIQELNAEPGGLFSG